MKKFFFLIVSFFLLNSTLSSQVNTFTDTDKVMTYVEVMPEFNGGPEAMNKFLRENIIYPPSAVQDTVMGKVIIGFIVSKSGKVVDAKIVKGVRDDLNNEALRVVSSMPDWIPGSQKGEKVNVSYRIPINFHLK